MPFGGEGLLATGCDTVTALPATMTDAVRGSVPVLRSALKTTVPLPFPVAPEAMLIQDDCSDAVQLQPATAVTEKLAFPPALLTDFDNGETVKEHDAAA